MGRDCLRDHEVPRRSTSPLNSPRLSSSRSKPEQFHDEYQARVQQVVDSKEKGQPAPTQEKVKKLAPVVDLMAALKKSIASAAPPKRLRKSA